jgi:ankyrin repeat protein
MELYSAACRGDVQTLNDLLSNQTYHQKDLNNAVQMACELGKLQAVKCLVKYGADIFSDKEYAMYLAVKNDRIEVVEYLLTLGSFPLFLKN